MLNLGSYLRFPAVGCLVRICQRSMATSTLVGEVFGFWCNLFEHFLLANVGAVTISDSHLRAAGY